MNDDITKTSDGVLAHRLIALAASGNEYESERIELLRRLGERDKLRAELDTIRKAAGLHDKAGADVIVARVLDTRDRAKRLQAGISQIHAAMGIFDDASIGDMVEWVQDAKDRSTTFDAEKAERELHALLDERDGLRTLADELTARAEAANARVVELERQFDTVTADRDELRAKLESWTHQREDGDALAIQTMKWAVEEMQRHDPAQKASDLHKFVRNVGLVAEQRKQLVADLETKLATVTAERDLATSDADRAHDILEWAEGVIARAMNGNGRRRRRRKIAKP